MNISPKTKLALMRSLRDKKNPLQKGFTLIELMIVVAIVGILSAVALPNFLQARNAAATGSAVGEAIGLAKECATFLISGGVGASPVTTANGPGITCSIATTGISTGGTVTSREFNSGAAGVKCIGLSVANTATQVSIDISDAGVMTCS